MELKKIKRILIANRGEIALRIMATCKDMDIETVSIYTESEKALPHALKADFNVCLGSGPLSQTYLNVERILQICRDYSVDAIHPGYGFLSENAHFSRATREAGLIFIGPSAESIELMGDKIGSKKRLADVDVPLIPGYHGSDQSSKQLEKEAKEMGFPVLIKASAGGGGKGMRIVHAQEEFLEALDAAKRESLNAFGDDNVLIEKFIQNPRHIEVQVLSDQHGQHFHLFERECSIQRRYQKVVEESPSPSLYENTRQAITRAAVNITKAISYEGAGTVEFILDDSTEEQSFYFLEMNTRLQVEHPVTEMVTRVDLVREQIQIAQGQKISFSQESVRPRGHSIEVRLYAENPYDEFLPSTGTIKKVGSASVLDKDVRFDCGYLDGNKVTIDFDPMLAKLIVWASDRTSAAKKLSQALDQFPFFGVVTNRFYLKNILNHPKFLEGQTYTHFAETYKDELIEKTLMDLSETEKALSLAAYYFSKTAIGNKGHSFDTKSQPDEAQSFAWSELKTFRNV